MPNIELIWFPGTCSRVTLIALEEIGIRFTTTLAPVFRPPTSGFLSLNPKAKVPVLLIDGVPLTENPAIVTYLARLYPEARLLPGGNPLDEVDALATMSWFAAGLHPAINRLRLPVRTCDQPESFQRIRAMAAEVLRGCFAILEERLADREWLYGDWSAVDGYMLWCWFRAVGSGMDSSGLPRCAEHARRCESRPSVHRALERENAEFARWRESSGRDVAVGPHQVGRVPTGPTSLEALDVDEQG